MEVEPSLESREDVSIHLDTNERQNTVDLGHVHKHERK